MTVPPGSVSVILALCRSLELRSLFRPASKNASRPNGFLKSETKISTSGPLQLDDRVRRQDLALDEPGAEARQGRRADPNRAERQVDASHVIHPRLENPDEMRRHRSLPGARRGSTRTSRSRPRSSSRSTATRSASARSRTATTCASPSTLTKTKQPELHRYWTARDRAANARLFRLVAEVLRAIAAEVFHAGRRVAVQGVPVPEPLLGVGVRRPSGGIPPAPQPP